MSTPYTRAALLALSGVPLFAYAQDPQPVAAPLAASATAVPADAAASHPAAALDPIVVTAQRAPQPLAQTLAQTTVFTRDEIDNSSAFDLAGLLALAPGAQVSTTGPVGSTASLFLRGASSAQSLVLIDGVRVDSVSLGSAQLGQLMLDQIDHVEVVDGNVSALYGSGAIGGVVQIFTRDGGNHPPRFYASTSYGSYHTQEQQAGVSGRLDADGRTTFSVALSRYKTDGFSSQDPALEPGANPNANGYLNESVSASLKHRFNDRWEAGASFFQTNGQASYDNAFGSSTSELDKLYSRVQVASAWLRGAITPWWTSRVSVSSGADRQTSWLNGVYSSGSYDFAGQYHGAYPYGTQVNGAYTDYYDTDNRTYTWQNDFTLAAGQKLQAGYEHLDQALDSDQFGVPQRHVDSGWLGYDGRFGPHRIQASLRRDQYSDFGGANSYDLSYGFDITPHWRATLSYSDAFRAPSFDDLYFPGSGNLSVRPERAHSVEAAVQYAADRFGVARLSAFRTDYTDLIDYVPDASSFYYIAQNVGKARVEGLEASWRGQLAGTALRASATIQNPRNLDTDQDLDQRSRHFASFAANHMFDGWRVGGEWLVSGPRLDSSGHTLGGYGIVNLSVRYDITRSWYIGARIDNLFDKQYETAYGYNTPRVSGFVTVGWQQR